MIDIEGVDDISRALRNLAKEINDPKEKRKTMRKAAIPVRDSARKIAPKLKKGTSTFRYDTPKLIGKIRAPRGKGVRIAEYLKGNLAGAIRVLNLRKAVSAIVGPKVSKRGKSTGKFGPGTRRFDAYYAQMVFGSAKAFQRRVMIQALRQKQSEAVSIIRKEVKKQLKKEGRKQGLDVR